MRHPADIPPQSLEVAVLGLNAAKSPPAFSVVGVGASAGGLEAFSTLLHHLPADTGLAFVLIQQLDPVHPSMLSVALANVTQMPVRQATHGARIEPGHVYVIAPKTDLSIQDGLVVLTPRIDNGSMAHLPLDFFLLSLAAELGRNAIGVVLSGFGSDGTNGLCAIKAVGGITLAQNPRSARFPSMPQSAIDAGVVDYCMHIPQLAAELARLGRHLVAQPVGGAARDADHAARDEILARVHSATGTDFSEFKPSSVARCVARRLALREVPNLSAYLRLLDADPHELGVLHEEMLIHVTSFHRDPELFATLHARVFPELLKHKPVGAPLRVWVAGCSTGEEVYSLAIAWLELSSELPIQIIGSDLSEGAIQKARAGVYNDVALRNVSEERRSRYFTKVDSGYRVDKSVRSLCVFAQHDLTRDPPFSKLDLISCRNVLIYFGQPLQRKVLLTLHYCLNQPGFLVLGRSEDISGFSHLFLATDTANKIFMRTAAASGLRFGADTAMNLPQVGRRSSAYGSMAPVLSAASADDRSASNAQLVSSNDALQGKDEELETARAELQSINEKLTTLNAELQRRNQELAQVNSDLLNLALTADISILTLDLQRRIRRFTPRARDLLNVLPSDVGRPIDDIKLNVEVPDLSEQIAEVIETTTVRERDVRGRADRWYRMQIRPYTTMDARVDGVIISLVDIHELKQVIAEADAARSAAERANAAKDDFLAVLSHELRTPLTSMLLIAQGLRNGVVQDDVTLKRRGEALERAVWTQVKLIDDLLDVSRIVADKLSLDLRRVDFCAAVQRSLDAVKDLIEGKALTMEVSLDVSLARIWADRVRVEQVITNLLTNAIKFTPRGGRIGVSVDAPDGFARLRVVDTGIGIDAGFLPHVFARFSQQDGSITRKYGGLGLGLALARHLVERQGGSVQVESQGRGHGSTFSVTFPLSQTPMAGAAAMHPQLAALDRPGRTEHYQALMGLRVLFVDDDLRTREAVLEVLELAGARVALAASAAEARLAIERWEPQVILCDIAMPEEDGYMFIRKLRAQPGTQIPALAFTALAAEDDRQEALAAGFQLHLAKPIDIDQLRIAVRELSEWPTLAVS